MLPLIGNSQRGAKPEGNYVKLGLGLNISFFEDPYVFESSYQDEFKNIELTFLTSTSGVFEIEEADTITFMRTLRHSIPFQILQPMISYQNILLNGWFYEFGLSNISYSKSNSKQTTELFKDEESLGQFSQGFTSRYFNLRFRLEFGKYLFQMYKSKFNIGFALGAEPMYRYYNSTPYSSVDYPIAYNLIDIHLFLNSSFYLKVSSNVDMEFKFIPSVQSRLLKKSYERNPRIPRLRQSGINTNDNSKIFYGYSLGLKYTFKRPEKKRRRR